MSSPSKFKRIIFIFSIIRSLACIVFIFSNSLKNGEKSNVQSSYVYNLVNAAADKIGIKSEIPHALIRNLAHLVEFAMLGAFTAIIAIYVFNVTRSSSKVEIAKKLFSSAIFCTVVAILDELIQFGSEGRAPQISDALLDVAGALLGIFAVWLTVIVIICIKRRKDLTKNS